MANVQEIVRAELAKSHDLTLLALTEAAITSGKKDLKKVKVYPVALASMCAQKLRCGGCSCSFLPLDYRAIIVARCCHVLIAIDCAFPKCSPGLTKCRVSQAECAVPGGAAPAVVHAQVQL